ncbi:ABC transporter ATP-binding protein [Allohahella marinimesophila]|uniref:ABC transporter ATP-binding protein/permease n=1 Tax=Allohahella marinimesophila TaxID=1054972 RepID=A0ABP7P2W0_9GAMM
MHSEATLRPGAALLDFFRPYRYWLLAILLTWILTGLAMVAIGLLLAASHDGFPTRPVIMIGAAVYAIVLLRYFAVTSVGERIAADVRAAIHAKLHRLPTEQIDRLHGGDVQQRMSGDLATCHAFLTSNASILMRNAFLFVAAFVSVLFLDWQLGLFLAVVFALVITLLVRRSRLRQTSLAAENRRGELSNYLLETLSTMRIIRAYDAAPSDSYRFNTANSSVLQSLLNILRKRLLTNVLTVVSLVAFVGIFLIFTDRSVEAMQATSTTAGSRKLSLLYFFGLLGLSSASMIEAGMRWVETSAAASRISYLLSLPDQPVSARRLKPLEAGPPDIRFESVTYHHPASEGAVRPAAALQDVTCRLPGGKLTVMVGPTGSGKSTFIDVCLNNINPGRGQVFWNDTSHAAIDAASLRARSALVDQDVLIRSESLRDNVLFGRPLDEPSLQRAYEQSQLQEVLDRLPEGDRTPVGEGAAVRLSMGQKQRLAIARALYAKPSLVLLDEPTSALDALTEAAILKTLVGLRGEATVLIVAHRLAVVPYADHIIVLKDGRVDAEGSLAEVMAGSALFADLMASLRETDFDRSPDHNER